MNTSRSGLDRRRHCMIVHAHYPMGETRVQREAEALLKRQYEVDVICLREDQELPVDCFKGVNIYRLPIQRHQNSGLSVQLFEYLAFLFLAMIKVSRMHLQRKYNTVQVHNPPDFLVFATWFVKLLGVGVILDLHDLMPEFYQGRFHQGGTSWPVRLLRFQEYLSCGFADRVITVSHHWRQTLIDRGVRADKIAVVMNVADDSIFRRPSNGALAAHANGGLHLIYHGNVTQRYGLDLALQAVARLRSQAPGLRLTIMGGGDYMKALRGLAQELDLGDQVTFRAGRPAEELPAIILTADAGIVPYRNDPFTDTLLPTKLMEYAALGLPSIAARTTAISRYFSDTMVEFFTPGSVDDLVQSILKLYTDRERVNELARGADKFNERYNWPKISGEYVDLVERLGKR